MALFDDFRTAVLDYGLPLETILKTVTSNVAKVLKVYPRKGRLAAQSDADIILLDGSSLKLKMLLAGGRTLLDCGAANDGTVKNVSVN